jgi:hypothetical protein
MELLFGLFLTIENGLHFTFSYDFSSCKTPENVENIFRQTNN